MTSDLAMIQAKPCNMVYYENIIQRNGKTIYLIS